MAFEPTPPHDCRLTLRALESLEMKVGVTEDFAKLRNESTLIDKFFEQREDDPEGGEGGSKVQQIETAPAFKLTSGRMRGATWFEKDRPPQGIVWFLGAELHDERHKGRRDAYDILGQLDGKGELFPKPIDYKRLELDRRRWDTEHFARDALEDAETLIDEINGDEIRQEIAKVPVRALNRVEPDLAALYVAVSTRPLRGARSGLEFPMTEERFTLLKEAMREAVEDAHGLAMAEEVRAPVDFPGGLAGDERGFLVMYER